MLQLDTIANSLRILLLPLRDLILAYVPAGWIMSLPAITLVIFGIIALVVGMRYNPLGISFIGVILAILEMVMFDPTVMSGYSFGNLFVRDAFTDLFVYIVLIVAFLVLMSSTLWGGDKGTYNFLLMISFAGALWVVMATDLVALFLAWELMSTPTYILVALGPRREAVDGATKYFVMGLLATMLMLLGVALTFGVAGTTDLSALSEYVNTLWASPIGNEPAAYTLLLAIVLFIVSFGFKVGIFPGWQWVPDAYASADGSVTAYLAGGSKKTGVSANSYMETSFDASGFSSVTFEYYRKLVGLDIADDFAAEWFNGTWNAVESLGSGNANDGSYLFKNFSIPTTATKVRFMCECGAVSEKCYVDNVKVIAE